MNKVAETPLSWHQCIEEMRGIYSLLHPLGQVMDQDAHLRAAPLLIASAWEVYTIRSAEEAAVFIAQFTNEPNLLPLPLRKAIARDLSSNKHDLAVWSLAGDAWRDEVSKRARIDGLRLRSGKSPHVNQYYLATIGLDEMSKSWKCTVRSRKCSAIDLDKYITQRDQIIHKGAEHLAEDECWRFYELVEEIAIRTAHRIDAHVRELTGERFCSMTMTEMRRIAPFG